MYKATREFIKARNQHCESPLILKTGIIKLGTGVANKCFENSRSFVKEKQNAGEEFISLSGWLVHPFDKTTNSTPIIQHWWAGDSLGNQYDTSPDIGSDIEYVLDFNINNFAFKNFDRIKSCVAMSLLLKNNKFFLLKNSNTYDLEEITDLKTESLFKYL